MLTGKLELKQELSQDTNLVSVVFSEAGTFDYWESTSTLNLQHRIQNEAI